jgi:ubiquinone/menaquinone biosynthesis C-methylase UbiE
MVNGKQAELWNSAAAGSWIEMQEVLDRLFEEVGAKVAAAGFPGLGGQVLDIGCGLGATTLAMARRVGDGGSCLGVDISEPFVEAARRRAEAEGVDGARFLAADAQTFPFDPGVFHAAVSRFGVMFFEDPAAAFANIRRSLRPGGRLAFAAWRSPEENPFMTAAGRAAAPFLPDLPQSAPDAPGQFGFSRAERVAQILNQSGWAEVEIEPFDVVAVLWPEDLGRYAARMGPTGVAMQGLDEARRQPIIEAVMRGFEPFVREGVARFSLACWLVTARA